MAFTPRTTCPDKSNKCYTVISYGGWNKCIVGNPAVWSGSALANCVGYAWGRSLEIMRENGMSATTCSMPTCDAGNWISRNTSYDTGNEARLGAVAVFSPNHVAVVESIDANGVCTLSESGYGGPTFKYGNTISKSKNYNDHNWGGYTLKGFIYNPAVSDSTTVSVSGSVISSQLYSSENTKEDMLVREVGYLNSSYEPSISSSKIGLSVINYTTLLSDLFAELIPTISGTSDSVTDTSKLTGNCKIAVDFFLSKGLNCAAACGVAGNIKHESSFNTAAVGDYGTSFGICQWHLSRGSAMKSYVGSNWASNLTGQLEYLWHELQTGYKSVLSALQSVSNTELGCKSAADVFVRKFEIPANVDSESLKRQETAVSYFKQCIVMSATTTSSSSTSDIRKYSGQKATLISTKSVPSSVKQTGICKNYTNYTYYFDKWSSSSLQRQLANIWAQKGKQSSKNVATIDGYYLIAMSSYFATTGDIVVIELEDGQSFKAILGDSKGSDAGSIYGHYLGTSGVDIVEWESIGKGNSTGSDGIQLGTWAGKKVSKVYNYGTYLDVRLI